MRQCRCRLPARDLRSAFPVSEKQSYVFVLWLFPGLPCSEGVPSLIPPQRHQQGKFPVNDLSFPILGRGSGIHKIVSSILSRLEPGQGSGECVLSYDLCVPRVDAKSGGGGGRGGLGVGRAHELPGFAILLVL